MLNRKLSAAWEQWQQVYADQKSANRIGGGAIREDNSEGSVVIELECAEATTHGADSQERMRVELNILRKYGGNLQEIQDSPFNDIDNTTERFTTTTAAQHNEGAYGEDNVEHFWVNPVRSITATDHNTTIGTAQDAI